MAAWWTLRAGGLYDERLLDKDRDFARPRCYTERALMDGFGGNGLGEGDTVMRAIVMC